MQNVTNVTYDVVITDVNIFLAVVAAVLGVAAITLNVMVIYVIFRTKSLHTCTNAFIFSLCIAELLVATFAVSFAVGSRILNRWLFSIDLCTVSGFFYNLGRNGATYSLMMVSLDRCVAVSKPMKYSTIITTRTTAIMTIFAWCISLLLALIPIFGKGMYTFFVKYSLCMLLEDAKSLHMFLKELFACLLPAVVIIAAFLKIVKESQSHNRVFAPTFIPVNIPVNTPDYGRNTLKAMKALFIIMLSYALLCVPLSIVKIVDQTCSLDLPEAVVASVVWLSFLCCVINPIVIATMNRKFKQSSVRLLCNCFKGRHEDLKETDGFTITSGLQTVIDASFAISIAKHGDNGVIKRHAMLARERTKLDIRCSRNSVVLRARSPPEERTSFKFAHPSTTLQVRDAVLQR